MPAAGQVAYTLISRFANHLLYYRQEQINARSGVHTPRMAPAARSGRVGAALQPLHDAQREAVRAKNRYKSRARARVEHVFGVVKRLRGFNKTQTRH